MFTRPVEKKKGGKKINLTTPGLIFLSVRTYVCLMLGSKEVGGRVLNLTQHCQCKHQNDFCIKMGSN